MCDGVFFSQAPFFSGSWANTSYTMLSNLCKEAVSEADRTLGSIRNEVGNIINGSIAPL